MTGVTSLVEWITGFDWSHAGLITTMGFVMYLYTVDLMRRED